MPSLFWYNFRNTIWLWCSLSTQGLKSLSRNSSPPPIEEVKISSERVRPYTASLVPIFRWLDMSSGWVSESWWRYCRRAVEDVAEVPSMCIKPQVAMHWLSVQLSFMRVVTPCRSLKCVHPQCFDITSWYTMMEQTTTWLCPVCERQLDYRELIIDGWGKAFFLLYSFG